MTTSMSRRLNILSIMFKIIIFFMIIMLARLYQRFGIYSHVESADIVALFH